MMSDSTVAHCKTFSFNFFRDSKEVLIIHYAVKRITGRPIRTNFQEKVEFLRVYPKSTRPFSLISIKVSFELQISVLTTIPLLSTSGLINNVTTKELKHDPLQFRLQYSTENCLLCTSDISFPFALCIFFQFSSFAVATHSNINPPFEFIRICLLLFCLVLCIHRRKDFRRKDLYMEMSFDLFYVIAKRGKAEWVLSNRLHTFPEN